MSKIATVVSIQGQIIYANSPEGPLKVILAPEGRVWKKNSARDFTAIHPGDQILVPGRKDAVGNLIATDVWANIVSFYGMITNVKGNEYQVLLYQPEPNGEKRTVVTDGKTLGHRDGGLAACRDSRSARFYSPANPCGGNYSWPFAPFPNDRGSLCPSRILFWFSRVVV